MIIPNFNSIAVYGFNSVLFSPFVFALISFIGTCLRVWQTADRLQEQLFNSNPQKEETFDFIVVGAGSAGAVVANRLARYYNVLLLEAGGEPNPLQSIPALGIYLFSYPEIDWSHKTVTQRKACLNSMNQQSSWNAGRGLGGSGLLNGMLHIRGHPKDYDNWANFTGDDAWSFDGTLPFFKRHEDYTVPGVNEKFHGYGNDLRIGTPDFLGLSEEFIKSAGELGVPNVDLNGYYSGEGTERVHFPIKNGMRQAPFKAFIEPARKWKSLTIRKFAFVTRILFRGDNIAYGVEYDRLDRKMFAFASKEVIISAGAITTPKILMLSGLGPRNELDSHRIPVRADLPVGRNLQDHLSVYFGPVFINKARAEAKHTIVLERDITPGTILNYFLNGKGEFSVPGATASAVFTSSVAKARGEEDWPDIQMFMYGYSIFKTFPRILSRAFGLKQDEMETYHQNAYNRESVYVAVSAARPLSRGSIRLGGNSPYDDLIIDPQYLEDPGERDFKVLKEGVNIALKMFENTTAFKNVGAQFTDMPLPGCEHLQFRSEQYWECYIRRYTVTLHHPSGTCSMGRKDSPLSVVDTQLKVRGTRGLRVIDASIMPYVVVTNTQATVFMIAEKGADMILRFWKDKQRKSDELKLAVKRYLQ